MKWVLLLLLLCSCRKQPQAVESAPMSAPASTEPVAQAPAVAVPRRDPQPGRVALKASVTSTIGRTALDGTPSNPWGDGRHNGLMITGTVVNKSAVRFVEVGIKFDTYNSRHEKIQSLADTISDLKPGESWRYKITTDRNDVATYKLDGLFSGVEQIEILQP